MQRARRGPDVMPFPHQDEIRRQTRANFSFAAVHDPIGCAERGKRAFNHDGVAHFAE